MRAILCFGLCFYWGCFPPALPPSEVSDTSEDPDTDTASNNEISDSQPSVETDVVMACTVNQQCAYLDGPCLRGLCSTQGLCETSVLSDIACDDGDPCTRDDVCDVGLCRGEAFVCDDGFSCTINVCDGQGGCSFPVAVGSCLIEGACIQAGTPHPTQACRVCEGARAWSAVDGGTCDDGDSCTLGETCQSGVCGGGSPPDDTQADFLRVFAHAAQPLHRVELAGLVARDSGGAFATLRVQGAIVLGNGQQYSSASLAHVVVALDEVGEVIAAWAIEGGDTPKVLGEGLDGRVMWSSVCDPCTITTIGAQSSVTPETSQDKPAVLVRAANDGTVQVTALSHAPEAKDALDRTYLRLKAFVEPVVVRGAGSASLTLTAHEVGVRAAIWLVRFSHTLVPEELNGIQYVPAAELTWPELDIDAGPLRIAADGRIAFPFVTGPAVLRPLRPNLPTEVHTNSLMIAIQQRDAFQVESLSFIRVIGQVDFPGGFADQGLMGRADVHLDGEELIIGGRFAGQSVIFGTESGGRTYQSSQFWGLPGSGIVGAGLEGFVIRMRAGAVLWLQTLRPLGHPVVGEVAGSSVAGMASSSTGWMATGVLSGLGAWIGEGSTKPITAPSTESTFHQVYGEYSSDGRLLWTSSADGTSGMLVHAAGQSYLAGQLLPGTNGVGSTRIDDPDLEVPTPRVYIQRFNSAGALSCGAIPL